MSGPTPPSQDTRFLTRLESVRGCAAIMVAMTHCFAIFPYASDQYPLQAALQLWVHILFQGTSALITFFVISGYVLSISLDRSETNFRNILIFYMRRIFRIFPAHIVWMFIALALLIFVYVPHTNPVADGWFNNMNSGPMNLTIFVMNLALVITSLIPGEWTLTLELIVYLIYPLMYVIYKRGGVSGNILLLIFLMACSYQFGDIRLLHYLIAFYWGLATPNLYKRFIERISDRTGTVLAADRELVGRGALVFVDAGVELGVGVGHPALFFAVLHHLNAGGLAGVIAARDGEQGGNRDQPAHGGPPRQGLTSEPTLMQ